jgi:Na+/melibiose symporter-like transporter
MRDVVTAQTCAVRSDKTVPKNQMKCGWSVIAKEKGAPQRSKRKAGMAARLRAAEAHSAAGLDPAQLEAFAGSAQRMYRTRVLGAREILLPALSNMGRRITQSFNDTYRMFYFVKVLRLDMLYVTLILTLIGVYDVVNNPLMGIAYDRTRTRWGKARPYALLAPPFYFFTFAVQFSGALFINNANTADPRKILFVFAVLFVQETFGTIYALPVDGLPSLMTPNPQDRMSLGLWQTYFHKWGSDFIFGILGPLMALAQNGVLHVKLSAVFAFFGILTASLGTASSFLMSLGCRERLILQPHPAPLHKSLFFILKNKYALRSFAADFLKSWWSEGGYAWDVVFQMEITGGFPQNFWLYLPRQIMQVVSLRFVEPFKRLFGGSYRKTVLFMRLWDSVFSVVPAVLGLRKGIIGRWWLIGLVFSVFDGLKVANDAPAMVLEAEINREIGDYTEYVTGDRPDGTIGLLTGMIQKITAPLNAMMTLAVFRWSGYSPNLLGGNPWTQAVVREHAATYARVFMMYIISGILPGLVTSVPLLFYDLEGAKKEEMYRALNARRVLVANQEGAESASLAQMLADAAKA